MRCTWFVLPIVAVLVSASAAATEDSRRTSIVQAIESTRDCVVNIHGQKMVSSPDDDPGGEARRVNGMGTGVVIDSRGYILTNYHVVEGVRRIEVTMASGKTTNATLVSHDPRTDLAVIKIVADMPLPVITVGISSDLMIGETVLALGNAYGYEHTVTRGIISALHRSVEVSRTQQYDDLIQTDASINPGNSGGPLLNINGEMIGINVAVRAGAQGIGFAIPIDRTLDIVTALLSVERIDKTCHGIVAKPSGTQGLVVETIQPESPADSLGIQPGDRITHVGGLPVKSQLDIERAMLGHKAGDTVSLNISQSGNEKTVELALQTHRETLTAEDRCWQELGLRVDFLPTAKVQKLQSRYRGGLLVKNVRSNGPASEQGIREGDILVGLHVWETISCDNVTYVLDKAQEDNLGPLKFYVLRGRETLFGHLTSDTVRR